MIIEVKNITDLKTILLDIVTVEPHDNIPEPGKTYHVWWEEIKKQEVPEFNQ